MNHPVPGERKMMGITIAQITIKTAEKGGDDETVKGFPLTLYRMKPGAPG